MSQLGMGAFIKRTEGVSILHHYVSKLWRKTGLCPHREGTFKVSRNPAFAAKVVDVVGLPGSTRWGGLTSRCTWHREG